MSIISACNRLISDSEQLLIHPFLLGQNNVEEILQISKICKSNGNIHPVTCRLDMQYCVILADRNGGGAMAVAVFQKNGMISVYMVVTISDNNSAAGETTLSREEGKNDAVEQGQGRR